MDNDHGITGELREWFKDRIFMANGWQELHVIADRIDAAYHAAYQDGENAILAVFDKRGNADVDERMAEHGWYRALDADKEVIRADDELFWKEDGDSAGRVTAIGVGRRDGWVWTLTDGGCVSVGHATSLLCHYHTPTVEDVLRDCIANVCRANAQLYEQGSHPLTMKDIDYEVDEYISEYAKRLRLAGDAK